METAISFIYYTLVLSALNYLIVIVSLTVGWFRIKRYEHSLKEKLILVSVVVAVRNEEENILRLLRCLAEQDYPVSNVEVIIVDDHSEDKTREIIEAFIKVNPIRNITLLDAEKEGKKNALSTAFKVANGELILTTDGDCEMGNLWISRIVGFYQSTKASLIIAPVAYKNEKGFLQHFFSFDFMSLVASGAGSSGIGRPFMGNGANLAFVSKILNSYDIAENNLHVSGDDVFLIHHVAKKRGTKHIRFIKDFEAIVYTDPPSSIKDFFGQRIRWASKSKAYKSFWSIFVAMVVFIFNAMLVISLMATVIKLWMIAIFILFVIFKLLVDLPLLYEFSGFTGKGKRIVFLPLFELIYPFYITVSAITGLMFRFKWKGRRGLR